MMGARQVEQAALFYEFSLERHVPADHLVRSIDRFVELDALRRELAPFYSAIGRPWPSPAARGRSGPDRRDNNRSSARCTPFMRRAHKPMRVRASNRPPVSSLPTGHVFA